MFQASKLELAATALTSLLRSQPALLEMVVVMGHIQGFLRNLGSKKPLVSKSSLLVLRQLSNNDLCISSIINHPHTLNLLMTAIRFDPSLTQVACETLDKLFSSRSESFVQQAIQANVVQELLKLLDSKQSNHSSSTKALIVQVLKTMANSLVHGEEITAILEESGVWSEFKDQKHDLFISNQRTPNYITGKQKLFLNQYSFHLILV
jgi:DnaJ family protein C protein 13